MNNCAIIVAGGSGTRMGAPLPKQYLEIGGKPILMHTLSKFLKFSPKIDLILVLPSPDMDLWKSLCLQHEFTVKHTVISGGKTRFQSVKNGLAALGEDHDLVAIHDGVRPFVSVEVIKNSFIEAQKSGSAIAVAPLKDSLRKLRVHGGSHFQDRQQFRLVQTPQTFQVKKIKRAFQIDELPIFTDDATVYEHQGWEVSLISGNPENIKITTPEDLDYAEYLLSKQ
ncbi:2-C-methyl-D-erythritol 4-phosphate cytidylyltransferase [Anditalea andensis]|uniref:2-C-methyl-D-erythritol 4-phosphate cytidylyltransferase n=1 Tax=Anditalea andensis TaxID=1048983 RepID=A0A074KWM8_9BACT|nr:2-C-methyl-D-erythritol 4-phosphate cytidylyltransferase [Anditalea andensis]KEO74391.1 2-C-methyl-D-erythritol 4-phosphate cytidylyltransferase [Anditalea andensis]